MCPDQAFLRYLNAFFLIFHFQDFFGQCPCKAFVKRRDCSSCKDGYYNLRNDNPDGCTCKYFFFINVYDFI